MISQSGENAPTILLKDNTLGTNITWTRNDMGIYSADADSPVFVFGKTTVILGASKTAAWTLKTSQTSTSEILLITFFTPDFTAPVFTATDNGLFATYIEIRVYP